MTRIRTKQPRLQLPFDKYRELHRMVLQRDAWRCQRCGGMTRLEVHHLKSRSQSGNDSEQNLITLCGDCHRQVHGC